jgi:hypothetical protein
MAVRKTRSKAVYNINLIDSRVLVLAGTPPRHSAR